MQVSKPYLNSLVPSNRNQEHPVLEDTSRVGVGIASMGTGAVGACLGYSLLPAFEKPNSQVSTTEIVSRGIYHGIHPIYKADLIAAEGGLLLGGPIIFAYGAVLATKSIKSLAKRVKNYLKSD